MSTRNAWLIGAMAVLAGFAGGRWTQPTVANADGGDTPQVEVRQIAGDSSLVAPRSPNLNAYAERFVRSIKESCLERMIFFGEDSLRTAVHHSSVTITANAIIKD